MTIAALRPARPERRAFTIADLGRMTEVGILDSDERLEIIDGEVVTMAAKGNRHEAIKDAINAHRGRLRPPGFMVAPETGLRLSPRIHLEPDIIVYATSRTLATLTGPDILLAVEVADSSLDHDLRRKWRVYATFGVREVWVIDAARRVVHRLEEPGANGFTSTIEVDANCALMPRFLPAEFALCLDALKEP